ncbi:MAG: hypothetical protein HC906_11985 [Bacteroidales bacterium]|nr:hypothetical protein [Bacteroidales bacterium]
MKKLYIISLILMIVPVMYAQEMIFGGNMENDTAWKVSLLNTGEDNFIEYFFNYSDDYPTEGKGNCLYVTGTNTGTGNGTLTNIMFYQKLTLKMGVNYILDFAYKDMRSFNYWLEVWYGPTEPQAGSDYDANVGATFVNGFKSTNWQASCPSDEFDGTFQNDACINETKQIFIDGEGDTTVYLGFRMGIYDDGSNGYEFTTLIDEVTLYEEGHKPSLLNEKTDNQFLYPNPFTDNLTINHDQLIQSVRVINAQGHVYYKVSSLIQNSADIS